jgi:hypothetical protein
MSSKNTTIKLVDMFLEARNIMHQKDYIWSLQGPTLIPTEEGKRKLDLMKINTPIDYTLLSKSGITIL